MRTLTLVYFYLMALLALTVGLGTIALGSWGPPISMTIALAKAVLIVMFFMKIRESSPSLRLVAMAALLWLIFLFGMTGADYLTRGLDGVLGK